MGAPLAVVAERAAYRIGQFTLTPHRQLLRAGAPVAIGRKALDVLSVLAQAGGTLVTKDDLMAAVWPNAIVEDNAIQVHIASLRKVLGADAKLLVTVHGLGYRLATTDSAVGLPVNHPRPGAPDEPSRRRLPRLAAAIVVIALLAIGGYLWLRQPDTGRSAATPPTIAVLAFQPADGSDEARLFAAGLASSVATSLSRYDVTVVAASSSLQLTPAQKPQARTLLGADLVVDGRVQSDHGRLTVSTQISDTRKNILVYGFDVRGDSALSTTLADRIATHLALSIDPAKFLNDSTRKFTASDYVLIARENSAIETGDLQDVIATSRALADRYPDDGDLQASAAFAVLPAIPQLPQSQRAQFMRTAHARMQRAIQLAPHSGLVYFTRANLLNGPESYGSVERLARLSVQASPAFAPAYNGLGSLMLVVGRDDEGVALLRRSTQLDPMSSLMNGSAAEKYILVGRESEAQQAVARQEAMWPGSPEELSLRYGMAITFGTPQDLTAVAKAYPLRLDLLGEKQADADLMLRAAATHDPALIHRMVANCFATYGQSFQQSMDAMCFFRMVQLGALDDAFRFAERGYPDNRRLYPANDDRWVTAPPLGLDPAQLFQPTMAPFRRDPRFWQVALRTGLIDYWQTTQQWPDFCRAQLDVCKREAVAALRG